MLKHLAIIPDGNRRYAKKTKTPVEKVYGNSIKKVFDIAGWCMELKIKTLTIWGFSTENWKRSETEKKILFKLFEGKSREILGDERIIKNGIKVKIIGDAKKFSKSLQILFREIENKTGKNNKLTLNILLNYGGRNEIISAVNSLLTEKKKKIGEKDFKKYLWLKEEPDLIIRTSGEQRLSGLLPFQSAYSELFFTKKFFPELTKREFCKIVEEYNQRERRFGK
ncbi:MAG: di-trans,poly-cis-decaprenylcistransferase [Candidatus Aenigmarchaeota archaeon]|nr:di-trans,poly-cis-decaprenylcistransferase [Candidatus Aenigmarchaeota archaeon]